MHRVNTRKKNHTSFPKIKKVKKKYHWQSVFYVNTKKIISMNNNTNGNRKQLLVMV